MVTDDQNYIFYHKPGKIQAHLRPFSRDIRIPGQKPGTVPVVRDVRQPRCVPKQIVQIFDKLSRWHVQSLICYQGRKTEVGFLRRVQQVFRLFALFMVEKFLEHFGDVYVSVDGFVFLAFVEVFVEFRFQTGHYQTTYARFNVIIVTLDSDTYADTCKKKKIVKTNIIFLNRPYNRTTKLTPTQTYQTTLWRR